VIRATERDVERFMRHVDKLPCGCWFWTGARSRGKGNRKWYGTFTTRVLVKGKVKRSRVRAHRFSCEVLGEMPPLPEGYDRDHTCSFSLCVNHEHLEYVTKLENQERRRERAKREQPIERGDQEGRGDGDLHLPARGDRGVRSAPQGAEAFS
jgi:hypothetical protein